MIAVDTNVLVRLLTNDHPAQASRAVAIFRSGPLYVAKTVLLECEWVLRYSYARPASVIARALLGVLGLPNVTVEDVSAVYLALGMVERGIDFADALHLASSASAAKFVTFDAQLVKRSLKFSPVLVELV